MEVADASTGSVDSPLEKYELAELLGQGGSGSTYRAIRLADQTSVAIKVLSLRHLQDWKQLELFEREAKVLSQLSHPQIPQYLDYFHVDTPDNRAFYIVQQLAPGKPLTEWVHCGWWGTEAEVKDIARQLLEILKYLHQQSPPLVHRDIKPHNIIRSDDGLVFLVDFGSVQNVYHSTFLKGSTVAGTYGYMAPEQFRGAAVPGSDFYGLGATILYLLTHRSPAELPQERLKLSFRNHVNISRHFADWLETMLEPDVIDRFPSAERALELLKKWYFIQIKRSPENNLSKKKMIICGSLLISIFLGYQYRYFALKLLSIQPRSLCSENPNANYLVDLKDYLNHGGSINDMVKFTSSEGSESFGSEVYFSLLKCAISSRRIEAAKFLLSQGADPNGYSSSYHQGNTLQSLMQKDKFGKLKDNYKFMKLLLEKGANPNIPDKNGNTPIHKLVEKEKDPIPPFFDSKDEIVEMLDLFMQYQVNIHLANNNGDTALHIAARNDIALYNYLAALGWNPELLNSKGESAKELLKNLSKNKNE
jgi:serine/threonine protein kinase